MSVPVVRLQFGIDGDDVVSVALGRWRHQLFDLTEYWLAYAAPRLSADVRDNVEQQGAPSGGWAPLSPSYAAWKAKHYPNRGLLVRTERLKRSLRFVARPGFIAEPGPDTIVEAGPRTFVFGTRVPYARHHQRPTGSRPPRRRVLFLPPNASTSYGKLLHAYAVSVAARSGLRTRLAIQASSGLVPTAGGPGGSTL